jgi:hypothetical protein
VRALVERRGAHARSFRKPLCSNTLTWRHCRACTQLAATSAKWHSPCDRGGVVESRSANQKTQPTLHNSLFQPMQLVVALAAIIALALLRLAWPQLLD